jgi:hypothetical protein
MGSWRLGDRKPYKPRGDREVDGSRAITRLRWVDRSHVGRHDERSPTV